MDIRIRLATQDDNERIMEVQTLSLLSTSEEFYNEKQIESLVRSQKKARLDYPDLEFGIVAEYENQIVGCGFCWFYTPQITGLYVHPDFQNRGIGTKIEEELEKFLIQFDYQSVEVFSSLSAVKFYNNRGFEFVKEADLYSEKKILISTAVLRKNLRLTGFEEIKISLFSPVEVFCQLTLDDCWQAQKFRIFSNEVYKTLSFFWNWLGLFALGLLLFDKMVMPILIIIFIFLCFNLYLSVVKRWMIKKRAEDSDITNQEFNVKFLPKAIEFKYSNKDVQTIPISDFARFFNYKEIILLVHGSKSYIIPTRCFKSKKEMLIVLFQLKNNIGNSN